MRQAASTIIVCVCVVIASAARGSDRASDAAGTIARLCRLVDAKDYASAASLLEDLLLESGAKERTEILGMLKQSYEVLARDAEAAGRAREAADYRDNLAILGASQPPAKPVAPISPPAKPPTQEPRSSPAASHDEPARPPENPPQPKGPKVLAPSASPAAPPKALDEPAALSEPAAMPKAAPAPRRVVEPAPSRPAALEPSPAGPSVGEADRLFSAKKYDEAGRCYGLLAREQRLPSNRTNHWAYCRIVGVATRMNARPKTSTEWDEIEAEIQSIQRLAPNLWYGEYLRNRLAEVRKGRSRTQAQSDNLVVRGSAPEESEDQPRRFPRLFGKSRASNAAKAEPDDPPASAASEHVADRAQVPVNLAGNPPQAQPSIGGNEEVTGRGTTAVAAGQASEASEAQPGNGSHDATPSATWKVHDTANFRIFHTDPRLAELAAEAAESVRAEQAKRWRSPALQKPWNPRCEIHLHPTGKAFAAATGQAETSPGFSTIESDGTRITTRRVLLRGDHPHMLAAILPHEITHVVVADLFADQQIPRWADEGIAVLSEPKAEQNLRAADLHDSFSAGQVFELRKLMSIDTPDAKDWGLYYAQSVSLARFLVEQAAPEQMIQFVRESGRKGIEPALREIYGIGGFAELEERWQAFAREQLATTR